MVTLNDLKLEQSTNFDKTKNSNTTTITTKINHNSKLALSVVIFIPRFIKTRGLFNRLNTHVVSVAVIAVFISFRSTHAIKNC